jgi:hypothetical protein
MADSAPPISLESLPEHVRRPHLRTMQPLPVQTQAGRSFVALRDPTMLSQQTMVVPPQTLQVLQHFRGDRPLDQIATTIGAPLNQLMELATALDEVGLLWGPTSEKMEAALLDKVRSTQTFPAMSSAALGADAAACRKAIDEFFNQTDDPELETAPLGIVAPHLDYQRGWPNYAAAYLPLREQAPPERVVILGTNHFGAGDGVVLTEFGFESPLGRCPADTAVVNDLVTALGKKIVIDQLDHYAEHSIQLQLPWLQHCWGDVPLIAALVPDPLSPMAAARLRSSSSTPSAWPWRRPAAARSSSRRAISATSARSSANRALWMSSAASTSSVTTAR